MIYNGQYPGEQEGEYEAIEARWVVPLWLEWLLTWWV
jgi:hypothetical protein